MSGSLFCGACAPINPKSLTFWEDEHLLEDVPRLILQILRDLGMLPYHDLQGYGTCHAEISDISWYQYHYGLLDLKGTLIYP